MVLFALLLTITGGFAMAFQSPTNTVLAKYIGNLEACSVNFAGGALLLALATLAVGTGDLSSIGQASWWMYLGGTYGVSVVLLITYTVPVIGIALTLTEIMLGQLIMGAVIDNWGLLQSSVVPVGLFRILGCLFVAIGILIIYVSHEKESVAGGKVGTASIVAMIGAFAAGVIGALQSPTNVALAQVVGTVEASLVSFSCGLTFIVCLIVVVRLAKIGRKSSGVEVTGEIGAANAMRGEQRTIRVSGHVKPWMFIGGVYGAASVFINVIATPIIGVALLVAGIMLGQLIGGVIIDSLGLMRMPKLGVNKKRLCGILVIGIGIVFVTAANL